LNTDSNGNNGAIAGNLTKSPALWRCSLMEPSHSNLPNAAPYDWANDLAANGTIKVVVASTSPANISAQVTGNNLTLTWPADHTGWRLQAQTNDLNVGLGTNWLMSPTRPASIKSLFPSAHPMPVFSSG